MQSHSNSYYFFQTIKWVCSRFIKTVWKNIFLASFKKMFLRFVSSHFPVRAHKRLQTWFDFLFTFVFPLYFEFSSKRFFKNEAWDLIAQKSLMQKASEIRKLSLIITFPSGAEVIALWRFRLKLWKSNIAYFSCIFLTSPISHSF